MIRLMLALGFCSFPCLHSWGDHIQTVCHHPGLCVWNKTRGCCKRTELAERYLYTIRNSVVGVLGASDTYAGGPFHPNACPTHGQTMVGIPRLEALHEILHKAYNLKGLRGDFLEAGVWRGGVCVYAKAFFEAYGIRSHVWVADSFQGLPGKEHAEDSSSWTQFYHLSIGLKEVRDIFRRYALLDSHVHFVKGFFKETMPRLQAELGSLSVLRVDGDMYHSTLRVLCSLYDKLEVGGYWMCDDYQGVDYKGVREATLAVDRFLEVNNIQDERETMPDKSFVFVKKSGGLVDAKWCESELARQ